MALVSRMLKAAKTANPSAVQANSPGRAIVIPTQMPTQHSPPRIVEESASPKTRYSRKYDPKRTGKRNKMPRSNCS